MRSEKEIRELKDKLEKRIEELEDEGFVELTDKGDHWIECLDWVLEED